MRTYQMALDDSILSLSDIAVNPGPVAQEFPWEVFEPVRKRYEDARFRHLKRQTKKAKGQIKKKRGRPLKCTAKLFFVAEEELARCEDDSPGTGGFPAYDFHPPARRLPHLASVRLRAERREHLERAQPQPLLRVSVRVRRSGACQRF